MQLNTMLAHTRVVELNYLAGSPILFSFDETKYEIYDFKPKEFKNGRASGNKKFSFRKKKKNANWNSIKRAIIYIHYKTKIRSCQTGIFNHKKPPYEYPYYTLTSYTAAKIYFILLHFK